MTMIDLYRIYTNTKDPVITKVYDHDRIVWKTQYYETTYKKDGFFSKTQKQRITNGYGNV